MVIVKPLSLGFTVILLMTEAVVHKCFCKIGVLKKWLSELHFIKKRFQIRLFPVKFAKFLGTPFFTAEHLRWLLLVESETYNTVKPVYSGYSRFLKKVSAITSCPLYRVLDFLGKRRQWKLRSRIFSYDTSKHINSVNKIYFKIYRNFQYRFVFFN